MGRALHVTTRLPWRLPRAFIEGVDGAASLHSAISKMSRGWLWFPGRRPWLWFLIEDEQGLALVPWGARQERSVHGGVMGWDKLGRRRFAGG